VSSLAGSCVVGEITDRDELDYGTCDDGTVVVEAESGNEDNETSVQMPRSEQARLGDDKYDLGILVAAAVLAFVVVAIGIVLFTPAKNALSVISKGANTRPTQDQLVQQVLADYDEAHRSVCKSDITVGQSRADKSTTLKPLSPQTMVGSLTTPATPVSPLVLADPPRRAKKGNAAKAKENRMSSQSMEQRNDVLEQKRDSNISQSKEVRFDGEGGPFTYMEFVAFYGPDDAPLAWTAGIPTGAGEGLVSDVAKPPGTPYKNGVKQATYASLLSVASSSSVSSPKIKLSSPPYLHPKMKNEDANAMLEGKVGGTFIVRQHTPERNIFVLSVVFMGKPTHHKVVGGGDGKKGGVNKTELPMIGLVPIVEHLREKRPPYWPVALVDHIPFGEGAASPYGDTRV
jgi:hypothetical protein